MLTRVDARGKFISRLTPHGLVDDVTFDQQPDSLTVTITYTTGALPTQRLTFPTGRLLVAGTDFPTEYAPSGYWIEQTRLYDVPGPQAWEGVLPPPRRKRLR